MKQYVLPLLAAERLGADLYKHTIRTAELACAARPGQFLHIGCGGATTLRRPVSIYDIDRENDTLSYIFQVRGKGTELLAQKNTGGSLDIIAPLGNGFTVPENTQHIIVIGGGIGIFPLYALLKNSTAERKTAILGFASADKIVCHNEFQQAADDCLICTDDGSHGFHGNTAAALQQYLLQTSNDKFTVYNLQCTIENLASPTDNSKFEIQNSKFPGAALFACGPKPMLKAVAEIAAQHNIPCQVSLEERMACGIGACLVCACKTKPKAEKSSKPQVARHNTHDTDSPDFKSQISNFVYSHVCSDGPVFDANEVIWE